jgi:hypothetical protein
MPRFGITQSARSNLFDLVRVIKDRDPLLVGAPILAPTRIATMNVGNRFTKNKSHVITTFGKVPSERPLNKEEIAALDRLARNWRTEFGNEKATYRSKPSVAKGAEERRIDGKGRRTVFAKWIARIELGPLYSNRHQKQHVVYQREPRFDSESGEATGVKPKRTAASRRHTTRQVQCQSTPSVHGG